MAPDQLLASVARGAHNAVDDADSTAAIQEVDLLMETGRRVSLGQRILNSLRVLAGLAVFGRFGSDRSLHAENC